MKAIPMLLLQGIDVYGIYKQIDQSGNKCWKNKDNQRKCEVGIAFTPGTDRSRERDPLQLMPSELKQVKY